MRLRLFEKEWLEDLVKPPGSEDLGGVGSHLLNAVLASECKRWFDLGRLLGYFDEDAELDIPHPDLIDEKVFFPQKRGLLMLRGDGSDFAFKLIEARSDLTQERQNFLRLMFFADEEEWNMDFRLLQLLVGDLQKHPLQVLPESTIHNASWAFIGSEGSQNLAYSPAEWRGEGISRVRWRLLDLDPLRSERWDALQSARDQVLRILMAIEEAQLYGESFQGERSGYRRLLPPTEE
jgi:hypothetical protein